MPKRRYEILLPIRHNDGRAVTSDKFGLTRQELLAQFGALSTDRQSLLGTWTFEGKQYEDELLRFVVDVDDIPKTVNSFCLLSVFSWSALSSLRFTLSRTRLM